MEFFVAWEVGNRAKNNGDFVFLIRRRRGNPNQLGVIDALEQSLMEAGN